MKIITSFVIGVFIVLAMAIPAEAQQYNQMYWTATHGWISYGQAVAIAEASRAATLASTGGYPNYSGQYPGQYNRQ